MNMNTRDLSLFIFTTRVLTVFTTRTASDPTCATAHTATNGTSTGTALPIPPSRLRATRLRWASRIPTSLATSRPRTTRRICPERPHRRRSAPYHGTSRIQPCARRQSTCALCPPCHFSPCSSGPVHFAPLRGIASQTPAGITSRPCRYSTPGPRLRGTQPYADALLGTLPAGRPPPHAIGLGLGVTRRPAGSVPRRAPAYG